MIWWFVRSDVDGEREHTGQPRISAQGATEGLQRGRKLQRPMFRFKRELRLECIPTRSDEHRLQLKMAGPLMNIQRGNRRMRFRLTPSTQWRVTLALLSATVPLAPSFSQGTLEQRMACTPDVLRLCSAFIPDADEITICLRERRAELTDACKTAFDAGMKQPPDAGGATPSRKRTTKQADR